MNKRRSFTSQTHGRPTRRAAESEVLYGVHPVREALRAQRRSLRRLFLREGRGEHPLEEILERATALNIPVIRLSASDFARAAGEGVHQGVALEASPLPELSLAELEKQLSSIEAPQQKWLVALDGVEDPQNAGAIARVAEAAGVHGLLFTERRSPPLSPVLAKASAGAIEHLLCARVVNLANAINELKEKGFWVFGGDALEGQDLFEVQAKTLRGNLLWIFGAEGAGLRPGVRKLLDHCFRIPMWGQVSSLNVASAAAVLLFEARRLQGLDRAL